MLERQFTSTVYVIDEGKVLLIFHKKLSKWLPPGGHLDPNETPPEAAIREVFEETGLHIELIKQENVWVDHFNAKSFERPYLCLLEEIPAYKDQKAHQHLDFIYLGKVIGGTLIENKKETDGIRWFEIDEVEALESDVEIFLETKEVIRNILNDLMIHR